MPSRCGGENPRSRTRPGYTLRSRFTSILVPRGGRKGVPAWGLGDEGRQLVGSVDHLASTRMPRSVADASRPPCHPVRPPGFGRPFCDDASVRTCLGRSGGRLRPSETDTQSAGAKPRRSPDDVAEDQRLDDPVIRDRFEDVEGATATAPGHHRLIDVKPSCGRLGPPFSSCRASPGRRGRESRAYRCRRRVRAARGPDRLGLSRDARLGRGVGGQGGSAGAGRVEEEPGDHRVGGARLVNVITTWPPTFQSARSPR